MRRLPAHEGVGAGTAMTAQRLGQLPAAVLLASLLLATSCTSLPAPSGGGPTSGAGASDGATAPQTQAGIDSPTGRPGTVVTPVPSLGTDAPGPGSSHGPARTPEPGRSAAPSAAAAASATPRSSSAGGDDRPLPACRYADKPARGDAGDDWATMVLDTTYRLPSDYAPAHLVSTAGAGLNGGYQVSAVMLDDLRALHDAAADAGAAIAIQSAYRSYAYQVATFNHWVEVSGEAAALKASARPGHSEHQLGTAVDVRSADSTVPPWNVDDWALTPAGDWMRENAWTFGFVMSYPKGKASETCYAYEPWHYRYVGRDLARRIHDSGETPRRFLWDLAQG